MTIKNTITDNTKDTGTVIINHEMNIEKAQPNDQLGPIISNSAGQGALRTGVYVSTTSVPSGRGTTKSSIPPWSLY